MFSLAYFLLISFLSDILAKLNLILNSSILANKLKVSGLAILVTCMSDIPLQDVLGVSGSSQGKQAVGVLLIYLQILGGGDEILV